MAHSLSVPISESTWKRTELNTTPLWPQANGEIERQNRSILKRLRIAQAEVETGNLRWITS